MYILDTNTLIYFFKGIGNVSQHLLATSPKNIAIPSMVLHELEYGIAKSTSPMKRRKQLQDVLSVTQALPFGDKEAKTAALIRAEMDKKGTPIGSFDMLIAGTALANQGTLVTNNTKEFSRISDLSLTNWL